MYDSCHVRCYSNMSDDSNSPTDKYDETLSVHVKRSPTHVKTELHSCARVTTCGHALCTVNSPLHSTAQSTVRKSEGPQFTACGPTSPQAHSQQANAPRVPHAHRLITTVTTDQKLTTQSTVNTRIGMWGVIRGAMKEDLAATGVRVRESGVMVSLSHG